MSTNCCISLMLLVLGFMVSVPRAHGTDFFPLDKSNLCQLHLADSKINEVVNALLNLNIPHANVAAAFEAVLSLRGDDLDTLNILGEALLNPKVKASLETHARIALMKRVAAGPQSLPPRPPAISLAFSRGIRDTVLMDILKNVQKKRTHGRYLMQLVDAALHNPRANAETYTRVRFLLEWMDQTNLILRDHYVHYLKLSIGIIDAKGQTGDFNLNAEQDLLKSTIAALQEQATLEKRSLGSLRPTLEEYHPVLEVLPTATVDELNHALRVAQENAGALPFNPFLLTLQEATNNAAVSSLALGVMRDSLEWSLLNGKVTKDEARHLIRSAMARLRIIIGNPDVELGADENANYEMKRFQELNFKLDRPSMDPVLASPVSAAPSAISQTVGLRIYLGKLQTGSKSITKEKLKELLEACIGSENPDHRLSTEITSTIEWASRSLILTADEALSLYRANLITLSSLSGDIVNGEEFVAERDRVQHLVDTLTPAQ